jgi:16S rRNA (guanine527-N7)-methyltransferase
MSHRTSFSEALQSAAIELPSAAVDKLFAYLDLMLQMNEQINLTAITDYREALYKHIFDSLMILNLSEFGAAASILDIGSGAGFPGIPLAICFPEKKIVSLDSTQKKILFQQQVCQELEITNLQPVWGRAEEYGRDHDYRERFDLVTARAVSALNILLELAIPFCKIEKHAVFYKGKEIQDELAAAQASQQVLSASPPRIIDYRLPENRGDRTLVIFQKLAATPDQYPRKSGLPQKRPL